MSFRCLVGIADMEFHPDFAIDRSDPDSIIRNKSTPYEETSPLAFLPYDKAETLKFENWMDWQVSWRPTLRNLGWPREIWDRYPFTRYDVRHLDVM